MAAQRPPTGYSDELAARIADLPHLNLPPAVPMSAEVLAAFLAGLAERSKNRPLFVEK